MCRSAGIPPDYLAQIASARCLSAQPALQILEIVRGVELHQSRAGGPPIDRHSMSEQVGCHLYIVLKKRSGRIGGVEKSTERLGVAQQAGSRPTVYQRILADGGKGLRIDCWDTLKWKPDTFEIGCDRSQSIRPAVQVDHIDRQSHCVAHQAGHQSDGWVSDSTNYRLFCSAGDPTCGVHRGLQATGCGVSAIGSTGFAAGRGLNDCPQTRERHPSINRPSPRWRKSQQCAAPLTGSHTLRVVEARRGGSRGRMLWIRPVMSRGEALIDRDEKGSATFRL